MIVLITNLNFRRKFRLWYVFDFPFYELSAGFEQQFKIGGYYANVEINQDKMSQFFKNHEDEFSYLI